MLHWIAAPAGGPETLTAGAGPTSFVVELTGSLSGECTALTDTDCGGTTPLTWSSGETDSNASMLILPETLTQRFAPGATFEWKVRLKDGPSAPWSEYATGSFDTTPPAAAWRNSSWIGGGSELRADLTLPLGKSVVRARAYATGVGAFELHLNGEKVGDHILDPGEAVYDQKVMFLSFNVTQLLRPGQNAVGARLGNSKFGYLDIYTNRTALGDQSGDASRAFRLVLVATLSDGSEHILASTADGSWHMRHGPIVYDHLWHGEIYDSRQELVGWSSKPMASFPAGSWEPAKVMSPKVGRLYPQLMQPIRKVDTFEAKSQTKVGSGVVFDMGHNMAGLCTLTFNPANVAAARDTAEPIAIMLRLRHTEITSRNGSTFNNYYPGMEFHHASATCSMQDWYEHKWYECANQTDGYVFRVPGNGDDVGTTVEYTPSFTYHGFRHVELVATQLLPGGEGPLPASLQASFPWGAKIVAHRAHTDMPPLTALNLNGGAKSAMIGKIFNATIAAHVSNVWSIPTGTDDPSSPSHKDFFKQLVGFS